MIGFGALRRVFTAVVPALVLAYAVITTLGLAGVSSLDATAQFSIVAVSILAVALSELLLFRHSL